MAKQYKVLKEMINAPVGTILESNDDYNNLYRVDKDLCCIIGGNSFEYAIPQGFIEEYTPEPKHWRADPGEFYWCIDDDLDVIKEIDDCTRYDSRKYKVGNYFRTKETAKLVAKVQKLMFEWLHELGEDNVRHKKLNILDAMDEAREAVLEDDGNE